MTTSYTSKLQLALPATGDLDGTWGDVVNNNITSMIEEAIAGIATISSWTAASHTLTKANGTTSEARCAVLLLSGAPGAACTVITPATSKIYIVNNSVTGGYTATVKVTGQTGVGIPNGSTMLVYCNGTDIVSSLIAPVINSPTLTGTPVAPTAALGTSTTQLATTAFAQTMQSPAFSGTPTVPTAAPGTNTTQAASTAFVAAGYAPLDSPALTGTPTAPTATAGDNSTKIATTAFATALAFVAALPAQAGNSGSLVTTDGATASWLAKATQAEAEAGVVNTNWMTPLRTAQAISALVPTASQAEAEARTNNTKFMTPLRVAQEVATMVVRAVTTATTATTLTAVPTLLKITPASYGVTVTLPDATTCSVGGPLHIIDNRGAYPVRVCDSTGVLKAFVFAGVVSHISLDDNSTAAGVWAIENGELVGASAQLLTTKTNLISNGGCIDLGSSRECIITIAPGTGFTYGTVYDKSTNTFGTTTLIRASNTGIALTAAVLSAANQVLMVSCTNAAATFEAVTLSISGTTITVNTAATATLSANISAFADGCGLIAVGSSWVASYTVDTPAAQIRALSISGTTVTIGSAEVLDGTAGGLIAASTSHVIAVSSATTHFYTKPYLVSGSTLTAGTGTDSGTNTVTIYKFSPLGTRWIGLYLSNDTIGGVVSLNTTGNGTTTISNATLFTAGTFLDAILVGSTKVLALNSAASSNANILTDTAGTASVGTAITLSARATRCCINVSGTDAYVQDGDTTQLWLLKVDCSGASPVMARKIDPVTVSTQTVVFAASNAVLRRSVNGVYGTDFAATVNKTNNTQITNLNVSSGVPALKTLGCAFGLTAYRGKADSERWLTDAATVITKVECVA